jgi:hypothetical protein
MVQELGFVEVLDDIRFNMLPNKEFFPAKCSSEVRRTPRFIFKA